MDKIEAFRSLIGQEIAKAKELVHERSQGEPIRDFDIRGRLYALGMELAPEARQGDLDAMREWLKLRGDEKIVDLAAGSGFFTKEFLSSTSGEVIAVDPSQMQLAELDRLCEGRARVIVGSPDSESDMAQIMDGSVDVVSSFGGLHHVGDQRAMMAQVARILKTGGRFTAADVCKDTALARHFDDFVASKCLTGHDAQWLDASRLRELSVGLPLRLEKAEMVPLTWNFGSEREMALFFQGLHAYDLPEQEIVEDLRDALGFVKEEGRVCLNWPMIFFTFTRE